MLVLQRSINLERRVKWCFKNNAASWILFHLLSLFSAISAIFHTDQMEQFCPAVLH